MGCFTGVEIRVIEKKVRCCFNISDTVTHCIERILKTMAKFVFKKMTEA